MTATVTYHLDGKTVEREQRNDARLAWKLIDEFSRFSNVKFDGAVRVRKATGSALYLCFVGHDLHGRRHAHTTEIEFSR